MAAGITSGEAVSEITTYFTSRRFAEAAEAREMAQSLTDYLRGRTWVLTEIGVNRGGEGLFAFTHRTFLEYFAAEYIANDSSSWAEIARKTLSVLMDGWEVVAQLVAYLAHQRSIDGPRELVTAMVHEASTTEERDATDSFAAWVTDTVERRWD